MTTMVASSDARSRENAGSKWLGWVSIGFLGLNLLLLAAVLFLWRYRLPAGMGVAREEVAPIASSVEVAAEAEPVSAPSSIQQAPLDEPATASRQAQAQPLSRETVKGGSVQGSGTQSAAALKASPAAPVPAQASGTGSEERTSAVAPSTTASDAGVTLASPLTEEAVVAGNKVSDAPASSPQADTVTQPAASLRAGDLDRDGDVDLFDVVRYASNPKGTDVNNDGAVDIRDLIVLDASFGLEGP